MTYNEYEMLSPRNEQLHVENNPNVRENVEFVPKALETIEKMILIKPNEGKVQHLDDKENVEQKQQYCLAKDRTRRQIKAPQRYAYVDFVTYALSMAKKIENEEP